MATSVPLPMATLTSARASACESLMPSPTMATHLPACCNSATKRSLSSGKHAPPIVVDTGRPSHLGCGRLLVAGEHIDLDAAAFQLLHRLARGGLQGIFHLEEGQQLPVVPEIDGISIGHRNTRQTLLGQGPIAHPEGGPAAGAGHPAPCKALKVGQVVGRAIAPLPQRIGQGQGQRVFRPRLGGQQHGGKLLEIGIELLVDYCGCPSVRVPVLSRTTALTGTCFPGQTHL